MYSAILERKLIMKKYFKEIDCYSIKNKIEINKRYFLWSSFGNKKFIL